MLTSSQPYAGKEATKCTRTSRSSRRGVPTQSLLAFCVWRCCFYFLWLGHNWTRRSRHSRLHEPQQPLPSNNLQPSIQTASPCSTMKTTLQSRTTSAISLQNMLKFVCMICCALTVTRCVLLLGGILLAAMSLTLAAHNQAVIISDKHKDWSPVQHHFQVGDLAAGAHTFDVYPRPPPPTNGLPVNTRLQAYYRHPSTLFDVRVHPSQRYHCWCDICARFVSDCLRVQGLTPIDWVDGAMWIVEPEYRSWELQARPALGLPIR
jgi:hypothetical protein